MEAPETPTPQAETSPEGSSAVQRRVTRPLPDEHECKAAVKEVFLWMYEHGFTELHLTREGAKATLTLDGKAV